MEQEQFDVRALLGATEKRVTAKILELGYKFTQSTALYGQDKTLVFQLYDTHLAVSFVKDVAVSLTVVDPSQKLREWLEKETQLHPDANLNHPIPPGMRAEVRKDDHFWYSLRIGDDMLGVTVTSRATFPG